MQALSTKFSAWSTIRKNSTGNWACIDNSQRDWSGFYPIFQAIADLPIGTNNSIAASAPAQLSQQSQESQSSSIGRVFNRPILTVSAVKPGEKQFFDIALRVVMVLDAFSDGKFVFLGTDFTQNPLLL